MDLSDRTAATSAAAIAGAAATTAGSRWFNARELAGLNRLGDCFCPGDGNLPAFSASGATAGVDLLAAVMSPRDRADFRRLLNLAAYAPRPVLANLVRMLDRADRLGPWARDLRLARIGVAGVVYSLYYGFAGPDGARIRSAIGWDAAIRTQLPGEPVMNQLVRDATPELAAPLAAGARSAEAMMSNLVVEAFARARVAEVQIASLSLDQRLAVLDRLSEVILRRRDEIVARVGEETGKCASDALLGEVFAVVDNLEYLRKHAKKVLADRRMPTPLAMLGKKSRVWYEPLGTLLVIAPWNYPFYQAVVPISIAFAAGNAVIHKPSEFTPLSGLVESILHEAGFERDWAQVIYGDGKVGAACLAERPNKVFFTGSVATGKKVMAQAAELLVPVELELGGKDPMILFADANLDRAVAGAMWGGLTNTGQSCTSIERIYVERPALEAFTEKLVAKVKALRLGTGPDDDLGRMTTPAQIAIVRAHLEDALAKGAKQLTGQGWDRASGAIPPIVLANVDHTMRVMEEESFGPFLPVMAFDREDEAIALANRTIYGLSACVWSGNLQRAERVARRLQVGNVSINNHMITEGNHALPFGGAKQSGIGRFKGEEGLRGFCNVKAVMIDGDSSKIEANWYPFTAAKYAALDQMTVASRIRGLGGLIRFALAGLKLEGLAQRLGRDGR